MSTSVSKIKWHQNEESVTKQNELNCDSHKSQISLKLEEKPKPRTTCTDWTILKSFHVLIVMIFSFVYAIATSNHYAYCGALLGRMGFNKEEISYFISATGISDIIGNIIFGVLFDIPLIRRSSTQYYCLLNLLFSSVILTLPFLNTFVTMYVAFFLWGALAANNTTKNVLLTDNVNTSQLADAIGLSLTGMGCGNAVGPFFTGILFDIRLIIFSYGNKISQNFLVIFS